MSTKLLIVRHGESVWNAEGRIQGQADVGLSALGFRQADALAETLRERQLDAVYTSPLMRARETAEAICRRHALRPVVEPGLSEVHLGVWQGRTHADLEADHDSHYCSWRRSPFAVTPHGGESLDRVSARVVPAVMAMVRAHADVKIAVVTHSIVGRVLICHFLQTGPESTARLKLKKGSITTIRVQGEEGVLEGLSDTSHLRRVTMTREALLA